MDYKWYDFNALIGRKERLAMCEDVRGLIEQGRFWHNSPKYQINEQAFGLPGTHWSKLKMSFVWS